MKRKISLILTLALCFSLLAGCGVVQVSNVDINDDDSVSVSARFGLAITEENKQYKDSLAEGAFLFDYDGDEYVGYETASKYQNFEAFNKNFVTDTYSFIAEMIFSPFFDYGEDDQEEDEDSQVLLAVGEDSEEENPSEDQENEALKDFFEKVITLDRDDAKYTLAIDFPFDEYLDLINGDEAKGDNEDIVVISEDEESEDQTAEPFETEDDDNDEPEGDVFDNTIGDDSGIVIEEEPLIIANINFPKPVRQIAGSSEAFSINGSTLSINLMKVYSDAFANYEDPEYTHFKFETYRKTSSRRYASGTVVSVVKGLGDKKDDGKQTEDTKTNDEPKVTFNDVSENAWYYDVVSTLSEGGLIIGMPDGDFRPNDTMTMAEFATVLARAKGLNSANGMEYWASNAIESVTMNKFFNELGEISSKNYGKPITREMAVAAISRAYDEKVAKKTFKESDIPDFSEISAEYRDDIKSAYTRNLIQGVDEKGNFAPQKTLTRAEACQLFFNVGMVSAAK